MVRSNILDDVSYLSELNRRADRAAEPFYHFNVERARHWDPHLYVPSTDPGWKTLGHGEHIPEAAMPLAKFVGTYTSEGLSIDIDMHQLRRRGPSHAREANQCTSCMPSQRYSRKRLL
jgi:hypothetical protein